MIDADAHPSRGPQIASLIVEEAPTEVTVKICRLCILFGLGFRTLQAHWNQQLYYWTSWCQRIHQTI